MNRAYALFLIAIAVLALSACNRNNDPPAASAGEVSAGPSQESESVTTNGGQSTFQLDNSFEGALPPTNQLILGIMLLEETDDAVTGAQAASMLVLWQALQSGTIQNQTERAAILRQIEGVLTDAQIEAIAAMQLTFTDLNDWAQANGMELPQLGQGGQGRQGGQGGQGGAGGIFADMSAEERAAFRQEMQNLSPEERQERLQEMGVEVPEGGFQGGGGQGGPGGAGGRFGQLMSSLIELLESKASL